MWWKHDLTDSFMNGITCLIRLCSNCSISHDAGVLPRCLSITLREDAFSHTCNYHQCRQRYKQCQQTLKQKLESNAGHAVCHITCNVISYTLYLLDNLSHFSFDALENLSKFWWSYVPYLAIVVLMLMFTFHGSTQLQKCLLFMVQLRLYAKLWHFTWGYFLTPKDDILHARITVEYT